MGFVVILVSFTLYSRSAAVCNLPRCISFLCHVAWNGMLENQCRPVQAAVLTRREYRRVFCNISHRLPEELSRTTRHSAVWFLKWNLPNVKQ